MKKKDPAPASSDVSKTSMMLPRVLWRAVRMRAIEEGRNAQDIVVEALEDYLRKAKKGGRNA